MGLGCGMSFIKYVLFIFNLLCALCGLALFILGIVYIIQIKDLEQLVKDNNVALIPILLIILGGVILLIACAGCCGAIKESHCMTMTYATFLMGLIVLQIALAAYVLTNNTDVAKHFKTQFDKIWDQKNVDQNKDGIALIQRLVQCCGSTGPVSYTLTAVFNSGIKGAILDDSCCSSDTAPGQCFVGNAYTDGCSEKIVAFAESHGRIVGIGLLALAGIELIGFIFACCLASSIRNQERRYA